MRLCLDGSLAEEESAVRAAAPATPRDVLRESTRAVHRRLESSLGLLSPALTTSQYTATLLCFLAVHSALEQRIEGHAIALGRLGFAWHERRKTPLLERDLMALGRPPSRSPFSLPVEGAGFTTAAHALGALYVIEGATLGGVVICRHVEKTLGLGADSGTSFFRAYGASTGARWRDFCLLLDRTLVSAVLLDAAVVAATATFTRFVEALESSVP